ncbi:uncharacterized protein LOC119170833 isoform X4 [Rhipicephalus microplus]|uniref:uncharacterized protein LOC119170833 isoform X4 n=1 Tax=Rhipicephalus microplus TaxID=6941 RepID=UPI003F6D4FBC
MCGFMLKLTGVRRLLCVASTFDSVFSFPSASGNSSAPEHNLFLVKFDNDDDLGERNRGYIRRHHPHAHTAGICRDVGDCICCLQVTVETLRSLMWRSLTLQFRGKHCHMLGGASIEPVTLGLVKPCLSCKPTTARCGSKRPGATANRNQLGFEAACSKRERIDFCI